MEQITSPGNNKVKLVNRLRSKRGREQESRFVIDYQRDLQRAISRGYEIEFLLCTGEHCESLQDNYARDTQVIQITPQLMQRLSYRENPAGMIAVLRSETTLTATDLAAKAVQTAIVLVDPRKPGNIGALLRTADAGGIDAIVLADFSLDLYNPNIIRNSAGACFRDNIFCASSSDTIAHFSTCEFHLVAADGRGDTSVFDVDFMRKTAVVFGTEDRGLPQMWTDACHERAFIPMVGAVADSLNLSVSGAVFMYEIFRQRLVNDIN